MFRTPCRIFSTFERAHFRRCPGIDACSQSWLAVDSGKDPTWLEVKWLRSSFCLRCTAQLCIKNRAPNVLMYHPAPTSVSTLPMSLRLELCCYTTAHDLGFKLLAATTVAATATAAPATTIDEGTFRCASPHVWQQLPGRGPVQRRQRRTSEG